MDMIRTVADHVALRMSLTLYNKEGRGKTGLPFPVQDIRIRRLFGYAMRPSADDKFAKLVGTQTELCRTTSSVKEDTHTMMYLSFICRKLLFERFGLTTMDILELIVDVRCLMVEFGQLYDLEM